MHFFIPTVIAESFVTAVFCFVLFLELLRIEPWCLLGKSPAQELVFNKRCYCFQNRNNERQRWQVALEN